MSATCTTSGETGFNLYEGEQQNVIAGHPVGYKYIPGDNDSSKPLVALSQAWLTTDASHTAAMKDTTARTF
ncbi:hypothetical protein N7465_002288 [Penicillium sp. CMV-2018d]|nr:hypothetical protein N7465_002288 [Penicillium sp. CMV-2018d]